MIQTLGAGRRIKPLIFFGRSIDKIIDLILHFEGPEHTGAVVHPNFAREMEGGTHSNHTQLVFFWLSDVAKVVDFAGT